MPTFAFIIPSLNESDHLPALLHQLAPIDDAEIIVVDGGSQDGTCAVVSQIGASQSQIRLLHSRPGRGTQMRLGAQNADAEILVFLHADSRLEERSDSEKSCGQTARKRLRNQSREAETQNCGLEPALLKFSNSAMQAATLRLRFDRPRLALKLFVLAAGIDSAATRFGDQGLVIRRQLYNECGGFADVPLFEDVLLLGDVRKRTKLHYLPCVIYASARRFEARGPWRQMLLNVRLFLAWKMGRPIADLAETYRQHGRQP